MDYTNIFHGAVNIKRDGDSYFPLRYTDAQLARYKAIPRCCYPYASSNVTMKFTTDAPEISFVCDFGQVWRFNGEPTVDIYENGVLRRIISAQAGASVINARYERMYERRSELCVYLPFDAETRIEGIEIGDYSPVSEKPKKLLIFGDSIAQGLMVRCSSLGWASIIERFYGVELLNQSVGGDTFDYTAPDPALAFKPDAIIVALGTNDAVFYTDGGEITANIEAYFNRLAEIYPNTPVTLITPPYQLCLEERTSVFELVKLITRELYRQGEARGMKVVNGFELVAHDPLFFTDQAHPNDLGASQYAINLINSIKGLHS